MASTTCGGNFNFRPSAKDWTSASSISSSILTASSGVSGASISPVRAVEQGVDNSMYCDLHTFCHFDEEIED